jgi:phosphoglycerol transferase MdoB-like AlkP superfamily enzyme
VLPLLKWFFASQLTMSTAVLFEVPLFRFWFSLNLIISFIGFVKPILSLACYVKSAVIFIGFDPYLRRYLEILVLDLHNNKALRTVG